MWQNISTQTILFFPTTTTTKTKFQHLVRYSQQKPDSFPLYIPKHQTDDIENTLSIIPSLILIDEILLNEDKEVILFSAAFIHITFK